MQADTAELLLDAAEDRVRLFGYNGFSFRELAADVGIKSASVHHHFPTKGDIGAKLARRYTDRFLTQLGKPYFDGDESLPLNRLIQLFRISLVKGNRMCLCGMLATEVSALPPEVTVEVRRFFEDVLSWLVSVLGDNQNGGSKAGAILAMLEGGLILARILEDDTQFDAVATQCLRIGDQRY